GAGVRAAAAGEDPRFREAAALLDEGVDGGAYSSAVLLVGLGGEVAWERSTGHARAASIFDIASVTKPLTAALFFVLSQEGLLRADGPAEDVLPFTSPDPRVREIRFSHLLAHTSGLPAYLPLYETVREAERTGGRPLFGTAEGHDRVLAEVLSLPLACPPGSAWEYSDLGYMLLGRAIEIAGFQSLERLMKAKVAGPLGMRDTGYLPLTTLSECETGQIVPTGWSDVRGREKAGEVDDENAAAMGGVAGHAGVFSTARDLFLFAREVMRGSRGEGRLLSRPSAEAMTTRVAAPPGCPRTLGFDTPTAAGEGGTSSRKGDSPGETPRSSLKRDSPRETPRSQAGALAPPGAVGHLGYTGCSLWIDPAREVTVVLLSNRVVYGPDNRKLSALRPRIHDAVWGAISA
ncbi:MAG TPA: serine hydrolase domain-containing protein, partial [Candidatus Deferrimicrobiaceae bacterium]